MPTVGEPSSALMSFAAFTPIAPGMQTGPGTRCSFGADFMLFLLPLGGTGRDDRLEL
jgi:hypothetical protein